MLPEWRPRVAPDFAEHLNSMLIDPWIDGPFGEQAREMIRASISRIDRVTGRYHELGTDAVQHRDMWVTTHGEPHFANQMYLNEDLVFVDWETLLLAPKERDVVAIPTEGWVHFDPDPAMIELFQLEWTLCEIDEYAAWFKQPHEGNEDTEAGLEKLSEELNSIHS